MAVGTETYKRVTIFCVNFNTESEISRLISTIHLPPSLDLSIFIVDNSGSFDGVQIDLDHLTSVSFEVLRPGRNLGYFGAVRFGFDEAGTGCCDGYILVANPDLSFASDFFLQLEGLEVTRDIGVVAPRVVNLPSGEEANPFMLRRPSKLWIDVRRTIHRNPLILFFYDMLSSAKQYVKSYTSTSAHGVSRLERIYAAHGSIFIFCPAYCREGGDFNHRGFLFAEELYVAEICVEKDLQTMFCPSLKVTHHQHASISKLKTSQFSHYAFDSLSFIRERFFSGS